MTKVVGIVNVTPDSFSDGGHSFKPDRAVEHVGQHFADGAAIVDLGAESTRPGADEVLVEEEWSRLDPVIYALRETHEARGFSIDTRHSEVARRALLEWSAELTINDVTGCSNDVMIDVIANAGCPVIVGHLPASAEGSITEAHKHKERSLQRVVDEISARAVTLVKRGIKQDNIIVDPGIGFGKSPELNVQLLAFGNLVDYPVMIGHSRKRFLGEHRLDPSYNAQIGRLASWHGANYLRVHDVARQTAALRPQMV